MLRFIALLATAISFFIAQNLPAQQHNNAWFRGTLSLALGSKTKVDAEFQHRRQNGISNNDLIDKNLMYTFRNWIHYQHTEDVKFSISPFAYFSNYKIIQNQTDETAAPNTEIRFTAAVELQHQLFKKFYLIDRTAVEYRVFNNTQTNITRLRNRIGFRYDFTEKVKLLVFDELLFNLKGTTHHHFFDHDRLAISLEYKVLPNLKFDVGYIYINRLSITTSQKIHENNVFLNLTYHLYKSARVNKVHNIG